MEHFTSVGLQTSVNLLVLKEGSLQQAFDTPVELCTHSRPHFHSCTGGLSLGAFGFKIRCRALQINNISALLAIPRLSEIDVDCCFVVSYGSNNSPGA